MKNAERQEALRKQIEDIRRANALWEARLELKPAELKLYEDFIGKVKALEIKAGGKATTDPEVMDRIIKTVAHEMPEGGDIANRVNSRADEILLKKNR